MLLHCVPACFRFARVLSIFQFRLLVVPKGYNVYITVLYVLVALVCGNISYAVVITVMLKRNRGSRFFARWVHNLGQSTCWKQL